MKLLSATTSAAKYHHVYCSGHCTDSKPPDRIMYWFWHLQHTCLWKTPEGNLFPSVLQLRDADRLPVMSSTQHAIFPQLKEPSVDRNLLIDYCLVPLICFWASILPNQCLDFNLNISAISTVFPGFWENYLIFKIAAAKRNFKNG